MMCSLLLKHQERHSAIYNWVEEVSTRDAGVPAPLRRRSPPLVWLVGWLRPWSADVPVHPVEERARAHRGRGVVFGSSPRRRVDAAVHLRAAAADRGDVREDPPRRGLHRVLGFPTVVDGNAILRLSPGRSAPATRRRSRRAATADDVDPGALAFPISPPRSGSRSASQPVEYVIMSQVPYAELCASSTASSTRPASSRRAEPADDLRLNTPEVRVQINRDKLSDVAVNVDTVAVRWRRC